MCVDTRISVHIPSGHVMYNDVVVFSVSGGKLLVGVFVVYE